jgi:hypothetical protein
VTEETGRRWCRATRALVGAAALWLAFVLADVGRVVPDVVPPFVFVAVPLLLLVAPPLVRLVRAPVPRRPLWLIRAAAVGALVLGIGGVAAQVF